MDVFETSARILSAAPEGASRARIMALHPHLRQDEIWWLLNTLEDGNLLERDSSSTYWTTVSGVKFLEIRFNMSGCCKHRKA